MGSLLVPFPIGSFVWFPWRRVWYLARVEETRVRDDVQVLIHVHGESFTKDKWMTLYQDGINTTLQLLQLLPTALTGIGSLPSVGNHVQLLVMNQSLIHLITSRRSNDELNTVEIPTLVGIVVKVLAARDASLIDVSFPTQTPDQVQWQRVQIGNGYINVLSETQFITLQQQLISAIRAIQKK